jgi:hypothetical protein
MQVHVTVAAQSHEWWELLPALGGAIIGALAGGIPAWILARRNSNEVLDRDRARRIEREKGSAFRVFVKLLTITNSIYGLRTHVRECLAIREQTERRHMEPWQVLIPIVGFTDESSINFEPDELAVFYAANERKFLMDLILLGRRHAASFSSFQTYCERREAFTAVAPTPTDFDGAIGGADLTREEVMRMRLYTIPMNMLAEGLAAGLEQDWDQAKNVAKQFGPIVQRYFDDPDFVALEVPEEAVKAEKLEEQK